MKSKLRILLIEDDIADAQLIARELASSGFGFRLERIQEEVELRREMEVEPPDLILSDHGLPTFSGFKALEIVRETHPQLPFIFISGSNDQGMVAQMYEAGATNYVFKRDIGDLRAAVIEALEPEAEIKLPPKSLGTPAQCELELHLPPPSTTQPIFYPTVGRLLFCPRCREAWDETGRMIQLEKYCSEYAEVVLTRQVCADCSRRR